MFWTFSYLTFSSMSNLPRLLVPFGLQHTFPPLQRPIRRAYSSLLDFLVPSFCFNVQSAALACPFWTFSCLFSASTSNPPRLPIPFGLPSASTSNLLRNTFPFGLQHTSPPLQRPICRDCSSLLDFSIPSLRFNVQSAMLTRPFWTSSCLPSASTSNPPRNIVPFGLPRAFSPLQRPICRAFSSLLDFSIP